MVRSSSTTAMLLAVTTVVVLSSGCNQRPVTPAATDVFIGEVPGMACPMVTLTLWLDHRQGRYRLREQPLPAQDCQTLHEQGSWLLQHYSESGLPLAAPVYQLTSDDNARHRYLISEQADQLRIADEQGQAFWAPWNLTLTRQ